MSPVVLVEPAEAVVVPPPKKAIAKGARVRERELCFEYQRGWEVAEGEGREQAAGQDHLKIPTVEHEVGVWRLRGCEESWEKVTATCTRLGFEMRDGCGRKSTLTAFGRSIRRTWVMSKDYAMHQISGRTPDSLLSQEIEKHTEAGIHMPFAFISGCLRLPPA
jgi:hypothetical protein